MKRSFSIFKNTARVAILLAAVIMATACKKDKIDAAILSLSPKADPIEFSAAAANESHTFKVTTNQSSWDAKSSQTWCKVAKTADSFTLTADENKTTTAPPEATITVTAGNATPITIKVTQKAAGPSISIDPAPEGGKIEFPAAGETKSFTVTTNQSSWDAVSDKDWCKVEKSADGKGFTLTAVRNGFPAAKEDATVTISASDAPDVVLTAKQPGTPASVFGDDIVAAESYGGGDGTAEKPYLITSAAELKKLVEETTANTVGKYYRLDVDIEVTAASWKPIGLSSTNAFKGDFDGNGHTVSGKLIGHSEGAAGFFGWMRGDAVVRNLTVDADIENTYNSGDNLTGGITGYMNDKARISGCTVKGSVKGNKHIEKASTLNCYTGGIAGCIWNSGESIIEECTNYASVNGGSGRSLESYVMCFTGGIIGQQYGTVTGCTNNGSVTGGSLTIGEDNTVWTGGIAGSLGGSQSQMHLSVNNGVVTRGSGKKVNTGGIAGGSWGATYSCNTNTGTVDGAPASDDNRLGWNSVKDCPDNHSPITN